MSIVVVSNDPKPAAEKVEKTVLATDTTEKVEDGANESEDNSALAQDANETAEDSEAPEKEDGELSEEVKPKKSKNGFKRRIDKLNSKLSQAEKDAQYWREQAMRTKPEPVKEEPKKVEANGKPKEDDFNTHAEYVEALTDWKVDQREAKREAKEKESQVKSEYEKMQSTHQERVEAFKKDHDDFEEVMDAVADVSVSAAIEHLIYESDLGPEIMYELAKDDGKELERIMKLGALGQAKELGKIEDRLQKSSTEKPETKTTKAPKPMSTVASSGTGSVKKSINDPTLTQSEYEAIRREQMKRRSAWG